MSGIFVVLLAAAGGAGPAPVVVVDGSFGGAPLASEAFG